MIFVVFKRPLDVKYYKSCLKRRNLTKIASGQMARFVMMPDAKDSPDVKDCPDAKDSDIFVKIEKALVLKLPRTKKCKKSL